MSPPALSTVDRSLLALHLERALERLLADVRAEHDAESVDRLRAYLQRIVERATTPSGNILETIKRWNSQGEEASDAPADGFTEDATLTRAGLRALQRLQTSLVCNALSYLSAGGSTALEVERMLEVLAGAESQLMEGWLGGESDRRRELLAQVFHDFRSPLTSIFFLSDALYAGLSGALTDTQRQQIGLIFGSALSLLNLVDNVLSSRNLETGELKAERVPFSVGAVAEEVERITAPMAEQNELALRFERNSHDGCRLARIGDPDVLRRILLNLVTNAIAYTDEGGITVSFEEEVNDLLLRVEDTGPGISAGKLEHVFKSFRPRAEEERSGERRFSGAGLGLSICHSLAKLVGGDIWVESEPGRGSRFSVKLPFPPLDGAP